MWCGGSVGSWQRCCMPTGLTQPCSLVQASLPKHLALYRHPMRLSGAVSACFIYSCLGIHVLYRQVYHDSDHRQKI